MLYRSIRIEIDQDPVDVVDRMRSQTKIGRRTGWNRRLQGKVSENRFKLKLKVPLLQTASTPVVEGSVERHRDGALLTARVRPSSLTLFQLMGFGLGLLAVVSIAFLNDTLDDQFVLVFLLAIGFMIIFALHAVNVPRAEILLRRIVLQEAL